MGEGSRKCTLTQVLNQKYTIFLDDVCGEIRGDTSEHQIENIRRNIQNYMQGALALRGLRSIDHRRLESGVLYLFVRDVESVQEVIDYFGLTAPESSVAVGN